MCDLPKPAKEEALYLLPYFGLGEIDSYRLRAKQWKFCILDETHSCFSGIPLTYSDFNIIYAYTSYRKWSDIRAFAIANRTVGNFVLPYVEKYNETYFRTKSRACALKQDYIEKGIGDKQCFLNLYREAEEMLDEDYVDYAAQRESIEVYEKLNIDKIRNKRRENGKFLLEELSRLKGIKLLYPSMPELCPLFIPILVEDGLRDRLRNHLIRNGIYCPIHWPQSKYLVLKSSQEKELYEKELSIICDQRYGISDMQRIVQCIFEFFVG